VTVNERSLSSEPPFTAGPQQRYSRPASVDVCPLLSARDTLGYLLVAACWSFPETMDVGACIPSGAPPAASEYSES